MRITRAYCVPRATLYDLHVQFPNLAWEMEQPCHPHCKNEVQGMCDPWLGVPRLMCDLTIKPTQFPLYLLPMRRKAGASLASETFQAVSCLPGTP